MPRPGRRPTRPSPTIEDVLGRMGSRNRVSGYAAAVFEAVTVARPRGDRGPAVPVRPDRRVQPAACGPPSVTATCPSPSARQVIADLLGDQVLPATRRLAAYAVRGGRARDIVATLDALVEDAARARGWRVARVQAADRGRRGPAPRASARPWPRWPATRSSCR